MTPVRRSKAKPQKYYRCDICNYDVSTKTKLAAHMKTHRHICLVCHHNFLLAKDLEKHKETCVHVPFRTCRATRKCHWCSTSVRGIKNFRLHLIKHHPDIAKPECAYCARLFPHKDYLLTHLLRSHVIENKRFKCKYCEKAFYCRQFYENHERTHTGEKPFICEICARAFRQVTALKIHLTSHDMEETLDQTTDATSMSNTTNANNSEHIVGKIQHHCRLCSYWALSYRTLYRHMGDKHGENGRKISTKTRRICCVQCNMCFPNNEEKLEHMKIHLPFECDYCTRRFTSADATQLHMRMHKSGDRPHACEICGKTFVSPAHLRRHVKFIHEMLRPFQCNQCDRRFRQNFELVHHYNSAHTEARPYPCDLCSKSFRSIPAQKHHRERHTKTYRYRCSICSKCFQRADQLAKHHRQEHQSNTTAADVDRTLG